MAHRGGRWWSNGDRTTTRTVKHQRLHLESLEPRHMLAAANLLITEFMASNSSELADGDGNFSDWIEIYNGEATAVDLSNYYLTDNASNLTRWKFPSVQIDPGEYFVVFASTPSDGMGGTHNNYVDAGGNLHTNFSLAADGEYLGLTYKDPNTNLVSIVHDYGPPFPPQFSNISYGIARIATEVDYVAPGAFARTIVPTSDALDGIWHSPDYVPDGSWISGTTGVGFGETFDGFVVRTYQANISAGSPIGNTLDNLAEAMEVIGNPAAQASVGAGNYATVNFLNTGSSGRYGDNLAFPGQTNPTNYNHFATEVHALVTIPTAGQWTFGIFSNEGFLLTVGDFELSRDGPGNSGTDRLATFDFDAAGVYELSLYQFERTGDAWLELFAAPGAFTSWNATDFRLVGDVAGGGLAVQSDVVGSSGAGISQLLGTNVQSQMLGVNSSFYTRTTFNVNDPSVYDELLLRMKYDDAFVAYLNGVEVARRNVTGPVAWTSTADSARTGNEVVEYEDLNITAFLSELVAGQNVLAIQGLNVSASDPDVLIMPELIAVDVVSDGLGYFTRVTPRAANRDGFTGFVEDTKFSVDRGFYDAPIQVAISSDTAGAEIYYTIDGSTPTQANGVLYDGPIDISETTTLRAAAFLAGYLPTNVDTQTYFFLNDVVQQDYAYTLGQGFPTNWGSSVPNSNFPAGPDYGLDPDIVGNFDANGNPIGGDLFDGLYASMLKDSLLSLPTMSLVMDLDEMFGPSGIYSNASQRGVAWERPVSVEWITPDDAPAFQVDAGIRIQGAFFRSNNNNLKKSFRLLFKNIYGPGKLEFPLFEDSVASYNTLVLRGGGNDGYTWNSAKLTEQYTRDQFMRDLQRASGHPSPHGTFAHLYINGVYWGLYNAIERPDNEFAANYFGGEPDNWDVVHRGGGSFEAQNGDFVAWNQMMALAEQAGSSQAAYMQLQGKNLDGTVNPETPPLLDIVSYIDYIIVNAWGGNWDWPRNNFWAGRDRDPLTTSGFHFFNWDGENTLGNNRSRSPVGADVFNPSMTPGNDWGQDGVNDNAGRPHLLLRDNPEYRMLFADRVHQVLFNDGILMADNVIERYQAISDFVELAMIGESARWGDMQAHRSPSPNRALTPADWLNERNWILGLPNTRGGAPYLPNRSDVVLGQLIGYGFYPSTVAPSFSQHGGYVPPGFELSMSAPAGTIWYTLDGSDPRPVGGGTTPTSDARRYFVPIDIPEGMTVQARVLLGDEWSALNIATFSTAAVADATNLRITELHYNPAPYPGVSDIQDLEFIELFNPSQQPVSLDGVQITEFANNPYVFASGQTLAAGARMVVARNPAVFQAVYGTSIQVADGGYGTANLSNGGERIALLGAAGETIQDFEFDDAPPWPTTPDGNGPSLHIIDPFGDPSDPANWRPSYYLGGSPGASDLPMPGDYKLDGIVDAADYTIWRDMLGTEVAAHTGADGDGDGVVTQLDYGVWKAAFGDSWSFGSGSGSGLAALALAALAEEPETLASGGFVEPLVAETASSPAIAQDTAIASLFPPSSHPAFAAPRRPLFRPIDSPLPRDTQRAEPAVGRDLLASVLAANSFITDENFATPAGVAASAAAASDSTQETDDLFALWDDRG